MSSGVNVPVPVKTENKSKSEPDILCDRCARPMFRMRAVYWCEHCGHKTDCCGH